MKKISVKFLSPFATFALLSCASFIVAGCQQEGETPDQVAKRVGHAKEVRKIFDDCWGKVERCSPADKAAAVQQFGTEAKAQDAFDQIVAHGGTAARGPNPAPAGPPPALPVMGSSDKAK
jgi:hypothetical protein